MPLAIEEQGIVPSSFTSCCAVTMYLHNTYVLLLPLPYFRAYNPQAIRFYMRQDMVRVVKWARAIQLLFYRNCAINVRHVSANGAQRGASISNVVHSAFDEQLQLEPNVGCADN